LIWWLVGVAVDLGAAKISDASEKEWFGSLGKALAGGHSKTKPEDSAVGFNRAQNIFNKLKASAGLRDLDYQLYYMEEKEPNAFAAPGGAVGITQGLLDLVTGEIGIAMVLAHELGHHENRHALRGIGRSLALSVILGAVFGGDNALVSSAVGLAEASYSRGQETQADRWGLVHVHRIYGRTNGALEFFEDIDKLKGGMDSRALRIISSHPYTPDRIKAIRQLQAKLNAGGRSPSTKGIPKELKQPPHHDQTNAE